MLTLKPRRSPHFVISDIFPLSRAGLPPFRLCSLFWENREWLKQRILRPASRARDEAGKTRCRTDKEAAWGRKAPQSSEPSVLKSSCLEHNIKWLKYIEALQALSRDMQICQLLYFPSLRRSHRQWLSLVWKTGTQGLLRKSRSENTPTIVCNGRKIDKTES